MKRIGEYHIEHYWQEKALESKRKKELAKQVLEVTIGSAVIACIIMIGCGFLGKVFEMI